MQNQTSPLALHAHDRPASPLIGLAASMLFSAALWGLAALAFHAVTNLP